jgi:hypothetical protein
VRRISTSQFELPTTLTDMPAMQKLTDSSQTLGLNDLANTASLLSGLKDMSGVDSDSMKSLALAVT